MVYLLQEKNSRSLLSLGLISLFLLSSCSSVKIKYSRTEYIDKYKKIAIKEMKRTSIPASITMAQAVIESGNGNSYLSQKAKNHFGIKCHSTWKGPKVYRDDDKKDDCFRKYPSHLESFRDHSDFLLKRRYAFLFDYESTDYKAWAHGLSKAGYATNPRYPEMLIRVIEDEELYKLDKKQKRTLQPKPKPIPEENDHKQKEIEVKGDDIPNALPKSTIVTTERYHTVNSGETLYGISKKYNLSVDKLKALNSLTSNNLDIGQKLLVSQE
ncbi:MAG: LysM repeat protein [Polaribacter sp.]|jgi:LysM repeat protein